MENSRPNNAKNTENGNTWNLIKHYAEYATVLSTVGFFMSVILGHIPFFYKTGFIVWAVGFVATIISGPMRFLKLIAKMVPGGWKIGFHLGYKLCPFYIFDVICGFFIGSLGAAFGLSFSLELFTFFPFAYIIYEKIKAKKKVAEPQDNTFTSNLNQK